MGCLLGKTLGLWWKNLAFLFPGKDFLTYLDNGYV